jgi:hypothetical protein
MGVQERLILGLKVKTQGPSEGRERMGLVLVASWWVATAAIAVANAGVLTPCRTEASKAARTGWIVIMIAHVISLALPLLWMFRGPSNAILWLLLLLSAALHIGPLWLAIGLVSDLPRPGTYCVPMIAVTISFGLFVVVEWLAVLVMTAGIS